MYFVCPANPEIKGILCRDNLDALKPTYSNPRSLKTSKTVRSKRDIECKGGKRGRD